MSKASWSNPKVQYDFTWGEWKDREKNHPDLTWKQYRELKGYPEMKDNEIGNARDAEPKRYSFKEVYNRETKPTSVDPVHYHLDIEPFDYIHDNDMGFAEGNVVKYISRWRYKENGIDDLYKAKQYIEMLIAKELKDGKSRT